MFLRHLVRWLSVDIQGRIIHEAGEAEASGTSARYNENLQSRTTLGPEIFRDKICGLHPATKQHV